jgi:hypothetical protein
MIQNKFDTIVQWKTYFLLILMGITYRWWTSTGKKEVNWISLSENFKVYFDQTKNVAQYHTQWQQYTQWLGE